MCIHIHRHLHNVEHIFKRKDSSPVPTYDTARAARKIDKGEQDGRFCCAGESKEGPELYDMEILEEGIEDWKNNYTRFLVLSPKKKKSGKSDPHDGGRRQHHKTSIILFSPACPRAHSLASWANLQYAK